MKRRISRKIRRELKNAVNPLEKLLIIIGGDTLYLGRPFLELCDSLNFEYIIRYKETDAPSIKWNLDEIKIIDGDYEYQNEIIFGDLKNRDFYTLNVISFNEKIINKDTSEATITSFSYVSS